jgi:hypothetical protein
MSVFPRLFFYRVFGCFSAIGVQKHYQKRFTKKILSKRFYKKIDQNSKTIFLSILFLGRFSVRGVQKHDKKMSKNKSDPSPFLASDHPPTTGLGRPVLVGKAAKNKNQKRQWRRFFAEKTRTQGGRYCKTRDRTELIVDRSIDRN